MNTIMLASMIGGILLIIVSALASSISLGFGSVTSSSTIIAAIGSLFGLGGVAGLIAQALGAGIGVTIGVAALTGFIGAFAISKLVSFMVDNTSDGGEHSAMDAIGKTVEATKPATNGSIGELWVEIGEPPIRTRFYYKAESNVEKGDKLKIVGVDLEKSLLTVEDLMEDERLKQEAREHEKAIDNGISYNDRNTETGNQESNGAVSLN